MPSKLEHLDGKYESNEQQVSSKLAGELELFASLKDNLWNEVSEHVVKNKPIIIAETAGAFAITLGLTALAKNSAVLGQGLVTVLKNTLPVAGKVGIGLTAADWGVKVALPAYDVWQHPQNLEANKKVLARNIGSSLVDYTALSIGGAVAAGLAWKFSAKSMLSAPLSDFRADLDALPALRPTPAGGSLILSDETVARALRAASASPNVYEKEVVIPRYYHRFDDSLPVFGYRTAKGSQGERIYSEALSSVVRLRQGDAFASGFFIDEELIATVDHFATARKQVNNISVDLPNGTTRMASLVARDVNSDLALLKLTEPLPVEGMNWLELSKHRVFKPGTRISIVGHPGSLKTAVVSEGKVKHVHARRVDYDQPIQHSYPDSNEINGFGVSSETKSMDIPEFASDAAAMPGYSGSPVISWSDRKVIGVLTGTTDGGKETVFSGAAGLRGLLKAYEGSSIGRNEWLEVRSLGKVERNFMDGSDYVTTWVAQVGKVDMFIGLPRLRIRRFESS